MSHYRFALVLLAILFVSIIIVIKAPEDIPNSTSSSMDNSEIVSRTTRIESLKERESFWHTWYLRSLAITLVLGVGSLFLQYFETGSAKSRADEQEDLGRLKDEIHKTELARANENSAEANRTAGNANERAARLEFKAADLTRQSERLRLEVARAVESAKKSDLLAARANLEVTRLKTPRTLHNRPQFISSLKVFSGTRYMLAVSDGADTESIDLVFGIRDSLNAAGWVDREPNAIGDDPNAPPGITISVGSTLAQAIAGRLQQELLKSLGPERIGVSGEVRILTPPSGDAPEVLRITVGKKP